MKKTLIVLAHPDMAHSRLNKALITAVKDEPGVTVRDLYAAYGSPDDIDVAEEQRLLLAHERIVFQFPLYWYSTPGLLKEWQDRVLEYGFAYGSRGDRLAGKTFKIAATTGAPEEAYAPDGAMGVTLGELFSPLRAMARLTQMVFTPPFVLCGASGITDEAVAEKARAYRALLANEQWEH